MSIAQALIYSLVIAIICAGFIFCLLVLRPWRLLSKKDPIGQRNRYIVKKAYAKVALYIFNILSKFWLTKILMVNIASMLEHMYILDKAESRVKATTLIMKEILIGVVAAICSFEYFGDTFLSVILTYMIINYSYIRLKGDGRIFLESLDNTIGDMVHVYNAEGRNIDGMFNRLLDDRKSYMYKYIEQMYEYLKKALLETDGSMAISEYNLIAPSRHLRLIFDYIYITYRYGDEVDITGEVLFNRNMLAIQREVHSDLIKMQQIQSNAYYEVWFIMLAVASMPLAKWYMLRFFTFEGFETIGRFLNSSVGDTIKVVCGSFALLCFHIFMKFLCSMPVLEEYKAIRWEEAFIQRYPKVKRLLDILAPEPKSKRRRELEEDIKLANGGVGVRPFYLRKVILAVCTAIAIVILLGADTYTTYKGIRDNIYVGVNREYMDTIISVAGEKSRGEYIKKSLENDMFMVEYLDEHKDEYYAIPDAVERERYIRREIVALGLDYGGYFEIAAQRIYEKYYMLQQIKVYTIVLLMLVGMLVAYMLPNLTLLLSALLNRGAVIYDEVIGCYTVVVLLISHPASNIYLLLQWLTNFATVFKAKMQASLDNLSSESIQELADGVEDKSFKRLVECMLLAYNGADLKSAFAGVEQRRMFQEESRRIISETIIKARITYSHIISWAALGCTFMLYIALPMVVAIIEMSAQLSM